MLEEYPASIKGSLNGIKLGRGGGKHLLKAEKSSNFTVDINSLNDFKKES